MQKKLFAWLDKNKKNLDDNMLMQVIKIIYCMEKSVIPHIIISLLLSVFVPIFWVYKWWLGCLLLLVWLGESILYYVCEQYNNKMFEERRFANAILSDVSNLTNSIKILIASDPNGWRNHIFKKVCEMVCTNIYNIFKNVFKCNVRVSVEYNFKKMIDGKIEDCTKMAARCSSSRQVAKKAKKLSTRSKYYSYKIFKRNNTGIYHLGQDSIKDKKIWYKNPNHTLKVFQYVAVADSHNDDENKISFILQVDCLDKFVFGDNNSKETVEKFTNNYLKPYANIISVAYSLGSNKKGEIGDV